MECGVNCDCCAEAGKQVPAVVFTAVGNLCTPCNEGEDSTNYAPVKRRPAAAVQQKVAALKRWHGRDPQDVAKWRDFLTRVAELPQGKHLPYRLRDGEQWKTVDKKIRHWARTLGVEVSISLSKGGGALYVGNRSSM